MAETLTPDICVIGAGSGGLSVAAIAAAFGVSCVLIEKAKMGGDCLNTGCVPSKALIAAARHAETIRRAPEFGVSAGDPQVNFGRVNKHVHGVIAAIAPNDSVERFTGLGVTVIEAEARFTDKDTVVAGDRTIRARRFVLATGSSAAVPSIPGLDEVEFLTNESIFDLTRKPAHLIVIGGGPIGMEMAQAHRRLGSEVTVLESAEPLGKDDPELAAVVLDHLRADGVVIRAGARVRRVERHGASGVRVTYEEDGAETHLDGSHLLVATGRAANVEGIGLEAAGIRYDDNGVRTDKALRTTNRRVYAVGDVAGKLQFTHVANYHAGQVIRSILFRLPGRPDHGQVPWVTYTDPELAQVGLAEAEARERHGDRINVLRWPFAENDRAQTERRTSGFAKVVTDRRGRILGASVVGPHAGEIINTWSLALSQKMKIGAMANFISPYPTLSEVSKRAAVTAHSDLARNSKVRSLLAFLRRFG